ncbi:MAG TPA: TIGR03118 family protein [Candidatus Binataceae bacterium]|nr:TIGR03118 family protein [Candidatus Binataceae bacterium]
MKGLLNGTLKKTCAALAVSAIALTASNALALPQLFYNSSNLVSDEPGVAPVTDPKLVNAWGISFIAGSGNTAGSPFWISDNNSGFSTLYDGTGAIFDIPMTMIPFFVTIPLPTGVMPPPPAAPTGMVSNTGTAFCGDLFIFDTEDGTLSGWQLADGLNAMLRVDNSEVPDTADGAVYKGLEMATPKSGIPTLYATDFRHGTIDTFQTNTSGQTCQYEQVSLKGNFSDPTLPKGYAPFNVKLIGGKLYVTYALQDAARHDDVPGLGRGFVDIFDTDGDFERRFAARGALNAPWGLSMAPNNFGIVTGQLLVGNFGDGRINVFTPGLGIPLGQLRTRDKFAVRPLVIDGLWSLINGTGALNAPNNSLYFTAGPDGESHGLFGTITPGF